MQSASCQFHALVSARTAGSGVLQGDVTSVHNHENRVDVVSLTENHALRDIEETRLNVVAAVGNHQARDSAVQVASQNGWRPAIAAWLARV
jgi:trimethylamine:corrinoid methyltransferase-like protein